MASHTLDSVVKDYLILKKDTTQHGYARMLKIAISCLRELSMDVKGLIKSKKLTIQSNNTVFLPKDYMDYVAIGLCIDGKIHELGVNRHLCLNLPYSDCGSELSHTTNGSNVIVISDSPNERSGEYLGRQYGLGGGNNHYGKFRIDLAGGRIILDLASPSGYTELSLEYTYDPSLVDGSHYIHSYEVDAVRSYMYWQDINMEPKIAISEKERARVEYKRYKNMAKRRHKSFTLQEAIEAVRKNIKGSPRL